MDVLERRSQWSVAIPFAALAAAAQLLLTVPLAFILNVGQDDAYTLHTTAHGLAYAWGQAISFEQNAPLYFIVIALWRHIDFSAPFARLFSVFCAAGSVALIPSVVRRYLPSIDPRWVAIPIAFNPFLIYMALEIRVYALIALLSLALLVVFHDAFWRERTNVRAGIVYSVLCAVALYTQYYLLFLIVAQGVAVLAVRRHRSSIWAYGAAVAAALAAFVPMLVILPSQMQNFAGAYAAPPTFFASMRVMAAILLRYIVAFEGLPHPNLVTVIAVVSALVTVVLIHRSIRANGEALLPAITVTAMVVFSCAIYVTHEHLLNRHVASLFFPATLSVYSGFTFFREPVQRRLTIAWGIVALVLAIVALGVTYRDLAKPGDWIRVNRYLHAQERADQPIAVFQAENALALEYYYHGPNRVVPIPQGVNFRVYDVSKFVIRDEAELRRTFPRSHSGIWLVNAGGCRSANIEFGCDVVEQFVQQNYRVVKSAKFYRASVRLLVPR
ncbi:MAG TPA: hypothetical protein VGZ02_13625 [Candidatus Baltobacteraceae bacterium]|jgi:hypothetical protein|nr:hypothetical protein [Candidatus Baltobacteraceae bacterium]